MYRIKRQMNYSNQIAAIESKLHLFSSNNDLDKF